MPREASFDLHVDASPEAVNQHLKDRSHLRLMPSSGRAIGLSTKPLAGVVRDGGFHLATSDRDLFGRLRPVARGTVEATERGSRVRGTIGLPRWLMWYLRIAWIGVGLGVIGGAAAWQLGSLPIESALPAALAALFFILMTTISIGIHVRNADTGVDALMATLQATLGEASGVAPPVRAQASQPDADSAADPAADSEADRRARARQADPQRT